MTEKYTGPPDDKRYTGETVDVTFSPKRCIHSAECVNKLAEVFDTDRRPWVQPNGAPADRVVEVVSLCPSGALHAHRKDGGPGEATPTKNVVTVKDGSYVQITGDLTITGNNVDIEDETRVSLCRCGASEAKPFCDNTHRDIDFDAPASTTDTKPTDPVEMGDKLIIKPTENGPIELSGPFELRDEAGTLIHTGTHTWLCRCGESSSKPFCDGTHNMNGFEAP